jgi:pseudomonalisin
MLRFTGALAGAALVMGALAPVQAATLRTGPMAAARAGFERTATREFPALRGMRDLGRVSDGMPMHLAINMGHVNRAAIDTILRRQLTPGDALYHRYLTPAETTRAFNPSGSQVNAVGSFLASAGFRNLHATPDNLIMIGDTTAGNASRLFATEIHKMALNGRTMYANVRPALIPFAMHGMIASVQGLQNYTMHSYMKYTSPAAHAAAMARLRAQSASRHKLATTLPVGRLGSITSPTALNTPVPCNGIPLGNVCTENEYNAQAFRDAYDVAQNPTSDNTWGNTAKYTSIALFTEGDMTSVLSDLALYEQANNLPTIHPTIIHPGIPSPDTSGADEFDLDTQSSQAMTQFPQNQYLYDDTSLTDADTEVGFDRFKTDDLAKTGSASFGECDVVPDTDGALVDDDAIFAEAAVQGQTVFASAGDNGTTCPEVASTGVPGTGLPTQSYPADSPYVISVGGTSLFTDATTRNPNGSTYAYELVWEGTGGGISAIENSPFWQQGVVNPACNTPVITVPVEGQLPGVLSDRCVPDVSMDADDNLSPALIYVGGATEGVGGTSLASPLAMASWALIESAHGNEFGFAGPLLYQLYKNYTSYSSTTGLYTPPTPPVGALTQLIGGFNDTFLGTNGSAAALPGYDTDNGLGSFDVQVSIGTMPSSYAHGP